MIQDRVFETTLTTGTGTITLDGAVAGYRRFVDAVGDGSTCYYAIIDETNSDWEIGVGTVTDAATDTLSRDTVLSSSNAGALVNFVSGSKNVFVTLPADRAVYKDANGNITTISVGDVQFDTTAGVTVVTGQLAWNDADKTLDLGLSDGTILQLGQEQHFRGINKTGAQLDDGTVVYVSGSQGNRPTIDKADATDSDKYHIVGVTTHNIADNNEGYVTTEGLIRGLDTATPGWSEGEYLYLDPTTPGGLTNVHPSGATVAIIVVAIVTNSHASQGSIQVITPQAFTLGNNFDGILRSGVENKNTGTNAQAAFTAINDAKHRVSLAISGSNNLFGGHVLTLYNEGYLWRYAVC
jgi:hypothetical protein